MAIGPQPREQPENEAKRTPDLLIGKDTNERRFR